MLLQLLHKIIDDTYEAFNKSTNKLDLISYIRFTFNISQHGLFFIIFTLLITFCGK